MNKNSNIFVGERGYRTNFFLRFNSPRIEQRYHEEIFTRNRFSLQGFLFFSLLAASLHFLFSDCYTYNSYCNHEKLLLLFLACLISTFICLHLKFTHNSIRLLVLIASVYPHLLILEQFNANISPLLITIGTSMASFVLCQVWHRALLFNTLSYSTLITYLYFTHNIYLIRAPISHFLFSLLSYNIIFLILFGFVEKARKERWVLVETFKRSERIFRSIYEKLPYAFFVIDREKRIHYTNLQGLDLLTHYYPQCSSCNLQKFNVNIKGIIQEAYHTTLDETLLNVANEKNASCFVSLKIPQEVRLNDAFSHLEGDNQYKVLINQIIWKNNYSYLVAIKSYSSKIKSEKVAAKAFSYLLNRIEYVTDYYDEQATEKQLTFKLRMLSQLSKFKLSILSTILMFNRMFNKNQTLSTIKNFNIRQNVLSFMGVHSIQAKVKECDLQVTFESSFPEYVCGDEYLFQQIFSSLLKMLLDKVNKQTKIKVQCGLQEVLLDNVYLLSFEFELPKSEALSFQTVSSKAESAQQATLDNLLDNDEVSFYLALIRPALEIFQGKLLTDETGDNLFLKIEIPFQGADNTKAKSILKNNTLKTNNYSISSQMRNNTFIWNYQDPIAKEKDTVEPEREVPLRNEPVNNNNNLNNSGINVIPSFKPPHHDDQKPHLKNGANMTRFENWKIREELHKLTLEGSNKNFGSDPKVQMANSISRAKTEALIEKSKSDENVPVIKINNVPSSDEKKEKEREDHEDIESTKETERKSTEKNMATEEDFKDKEKDFVMIDGETMSLDTLEKLSESVKFHERQLKLAVTKTLLGILDSFEKCQDQEKTVNGNKVAPKPLPILRDVGEQIKASGLNEVEMYKRVLGHLKDSLANQKFRDNFVKFMREYRKQVEDEIYCLQSSSDSDQMVSVSDAPAETSEIYLMNSPESPDMLRRALSLNETSLHPQYGMNKVGLEKISSNRTPKTELYTPPGSEKSKGRTLNERILMTPSITNSLKLQSQKDPFHKPQIRQFTNYFTDLLGRDRPNRQHEESKQNEQDKEKEADKLRLDKKSTSLVGKTPSDKELIHVGDMKKLGIAHVDELPDYIFARSDTQKRKWISKKGENEHTTQVAAKQYNYNKVFTILAADDSEFVFRSLEALPTRFDRKLDYAKNGADALKKYQAAMSQGLLYHLVILDLQMPVMDGFEAARNIRVEENEKGYPRTYICAMSAFEDQETMNKAKREGMDNFCQKPLRLEVLNNLMKTRMEQIGIPLPDGS